MSGAYTQDDLDAVNAAIRQIIEGKRRVSVSVAGRSVDYQSTDLDKLRALRSEIVREVNRGSNRSVLVKSRKGL